MLNTHHHLNEQEGYDSANALNPSTRNGKRNELLQGIGHLAEYLEKGDCARPCYMDDI
jgi:hypothetical protein